eukprot:6120553-Karenia_brevis.AAC.1
MGVHPGKGRRGEGTAHLDFHIQAKMAQVRSHSCPAVPTRVEPVPPVPPPPPYPPWGRDPPRLNACSFCCPVCKCTEFRLYSPPMFMAFACYQCGHSRAMAVVVPLERAAMHG